MRYAVHVKQLEPSTALCVRMTAPTGRVVEAVRRTQAGLAEGAELVGLKTSGPPEVCYLSEPRRSAAVQVEVSLPVAPDTRQLAGGVVRRTGGEVAHVHHKGPHEDITGAYDALYIWVHRAGYEVAGQPTEVYLTGPADTRCPEDYLTEVIVPVRRATAAGAHAVSRT
ncbi:GyrI-like domain-containing protein [Lentzea sp. BCCO 10_0798]|uniref:GyrI-like domain-containing protein n=1 Tax=Lentzea kristufekii TaxID=3095430 RepID=A0ABU4TV39_9PSEU|nr:GyrI-like domain-containing protein [Lentzea sp. BCCO 10_0798]MDX8052177.1 GyrI-like domain-containing protein [Lentzea sp. BCCO 10_0798]